MKKRILVLFLVFSMLMSLWVMPVAAETAAENVTPAEGLCPCGCGKTLDNVEWKAWAGDPRAGHYYLDGDYTQAASATVLSDTTVVLDLRGGALTTATNSRLFLVNGYLHVMDTVGGGRMMAQTTKGEDGGIVCVEENESLRPGFYFHSGTMTPDKGSGAAACGGLVYAGNGATFRMTGGVLMNGHAETAYGGGAVGSKHSSSTIEILGGKILDCSSKTNGGNIYSCGTVRVENCTITGGEAGRWGGNIHITDTTGNLTVKNALITNGVSNGTTTGNKYGGGNINVYSGATADISDSVISGGYAACAGGNLCLGRGTTTVKNTTITGGTCATFGENIYGALSTATGIFDGCVIDGGVHQGTSKLTLKGAVKIGATGLRLGSGTLTATGLTSGAEVFVYGNKTITGNGEYIKAAERATITASGSSLAVALDRSNWKPYGTAGAHRVYLTEDLELADQIEVTSDLTLDLAGFSVTAAGRAFSVTAGGSLTIFDSVGGGKITGSGVNGENGGVIENAGVTKLLSGNYVYAKQENIQPVAGGVVYNAGTLECRNGILDASAFISTADGANGGAVCNGDGAGVSLTMDGCYVLGGTASRGGAVAVAYQNTVTLTNSHFTGGKAACGGNVYAYHTTSAKGGSLTMTGCLVRDGVAEDVTEDVDNYGGNVYIGRYNAQVSDCLLIAGDAQYGGNLNISGSTDVQLKASWLLDGSAYRGGNIYLPGTSSNGTMEDCVLTGGTATSNGGNLSVNNGTLTFLGGEISYGSAPSGGNIYNGTSKTTGLTIQADQKGNVPLICHGTATSNGGNLNVKNVVSITDALIHSGKAALGNDLYVSGTDTKLTLGAGVTGHIRMQTTATLLTKEVYGGAISNITCQATDASFCLDGSYGECGVTLENGTMYVAQASVEAADGTAVWYRSYADAVEACDEDSFLKVFTDCTLELNKDLYVDLNGKQVTVTGDYKIYGMDSSGDAYVSPTGSLTGADTKRYDVTYAPNGKTYVAVETNGVIAYHRLEMRLTGVNIRPSADGLYYTAKWSCDDTLAALIDTYGVAVSTENMPDSSFTTDPDTLWTTFSGDSFRSGETKNSVVISGILKAEGQSAADNDARSRQAIFAKAYLTFADGTSYISQDNVGLSLYAVMENLDKLIMRKPNEYRKYNLTARNFYEKWKTMGMGDWQLSKIPDPGEDDVIDLLMVGHSGCYYHVEELYALAAAAGVKIRVCNVYYSGCPLEKHYNWWKAGIGNYQYYETYTEGRKLKGRDVSLEWCLAQQEWDVIMLAMSSGMIRNSATVEIALDNTRLHRTALLDYFREQFPNADLYFRQGWTPEIGYTKNGKLVISDKAAQVAYSEKVRQIINGICLENNVDRFNLGDAWELCRQTLEDAGVESNLCARLGNNGNLGDGTHDGDIGGGQFLNACVIFEILTGLDCRDVDYRPEYTYSGKTYTLDDTLLSAVREAAHKAVTEIRPTYPENQAS